MRTDNEIERDIKAELCWSPEFNEADIAVRVRSGVVTLTGFVPSLFDKYQAETAASRVAGVCGVANDIQVRVPQSDGATDPELARNAVAAIRAAVPIASEHIKVLVSDGHVTLEGKVEWQYQRKAAEFAVSHLKGVRDVENVIQIAPRISATDIQHQIAEAFRRSAEVDADSVTVEARGSEVTLRGKVRSWPERMEAQRTAWSAPGVTRVDNQITVTP